MNRNVIYAIVVALIVLGIGGFMVLGNKSSKPATTNQPQAEAASPTPSSEFSLKELIAAGGSKKCTFTLKDNTSSGTTFIGNGKMRGDFSVNTGKTPIASHMIVDGTTAYIWTDNQAMGFKMDFSAMEKPAVSGTPSQSNVDVNQKVNYNCSPWTVDASEFVLPKGIDFKDMSAMMPKTTGSAGGSPTMDKCSACNSLTGDSKTQCLKALSCN